MKSRITREVLSVVANNPQNFPYDLSIGIIVKNEADYLLRCVKSLEKIRKELSCQLIITDTGSTDGTIEIAKEYADVFLQFDWCDDFSAARNTGVKVAEGRWFGFIDADEYFGDDCEDLIKFFKSPDHNKYSYLKIPRYDYSHTSMMDFDIITLDRFHNFSSGKRYFQGKIHEQIPLVDNNHYFAETVLHHTGYIGFSQYEKICRNEPVLYSQIKSNPKDIRSYIQLAMGKTQLAEKIEVCQQCLKDVGSLIEVKDSYYLILAAMLSKFYYRREEYSKLFNLATDYVAIDSEINLPKMEMVYFLALAMITTGNFDEAIKYIKLYDKCYKYLQKNPDTDNNIAVEYISNSDKSHIIMVMELARCYEINNQPELSYETLMSVKALDYIEAGKPVLITQYINVLISLDRFKEIGEIYRRFALDSNLRKYIIQVLETALNPQRYTSTTRGLAQELTSNINDGYLALVAMRDNGFKEVTPELIKLVTEDTISCESEAFAHLLYYSLQEKQDVFSLIANTTVDTLVGYITRMYSSYGDYPRVILSYIEAVNLEEITQYKELVFIKNLCYYHLINLNNINISMKPNLEQVRYIAAIFGKVTMKLAQRVYNMDYIMDNMDFISGVDSCGIYMAMAEEYLGSDDVNYIKMLKKALEQQEKIYLAVDILTKPIKEQLESRKPQLDEFAALAIQIKAQIRNLIAAGDKINAKLVLDQYSKLNPNDRDIIDLKESLI